MKKKILVIAGEDSGDLHGAMLIRALSAKTRDLDIFGMGGAGMKAAGLRTLHNITHLAAVGLVESLSSLGVFLSTFRRVVADARRESPDLAILIDFPEFNLRLASRLKGMGIPVVYYISPQVWAWRPWRIKHIARCVDLMLVFFKFEEELYRKHGVPVEWVGHPLIDLLSELGGRERARERIGFGRDGMLIGLLPGSRRKAFARLFPIVAESAVLIADRLGRVEFAVACAPSITERELQRFKRVYRFREDTAAARACAEAPCAAESRRRGPEFTILRGKTYDLMRAADLLIVASGTATLEAAIVGTPMVVTYKCSPISWFLTIPLINVSLYALANIVAGRQVVPELVQWKARPELIAEEVVKLMSDGRLKTMAEDLRAVKQQLGEPGAADRAADRILKTLAVSKKS